MDTQPEILSELLEKVNNLESHILVAIECVKRRETKLSPRLKEQHSKVDLAFKRRDEIYLKKLFEQHWDDDIPAVKKEKLQQVFNEVGIRFDSVEHVDTFLESMDITGDGVLDFEEFKRALWFPGPIEQWAKTVPLAQLLSSSIPLQEDVNALRALSRFSSEDIELTCESFLFGLKRMLTEHIEALKRSFAVQDMKTAEFDQAGAKFEVFTLSCGKIKDFHMGISGRVGK
jgi:hypothetical protein